MAFYQCIKVGGGSGDVMDVEVNGTSVVDPTTKVAEIDIPTTDIQTAVDEFETYNGGLLSSLKVALTPNQDLHGYPEPWVGGAGKNKFNIDALTYPYTSRDIVVSKNNGVLNLNGTVASPEFLFPDSNIIGYPNQLIYKDLKKSTTYIFTTGYRSNNIELQVYYRETESSSWIRLAIVFNQDTLSFTTPASYAVIWVRIRIHENTVLDNAKIYPMIREASITDATFEPYSNICPISGHTEVDVDVSDGQTTQEQVTVNLGGTYYSGTLDVIKGELVVDRGIVDLGSLTWNYNPNWGGNPAFYSDPPVGIKPSQYGGEVPNAICSIYKAFPRDVLNSTNQNGFCVTVGSGDISTRDSRFSDATSYASAMSGVQLCYELATPQTIQLSPTMVKALVGKNHLSAPLDGQEIGEVKYKELFTFEDVMDYVDTHGGSSSVDYSTAEHIVGTWIDGKPLYEITFDFEIPTTTTTVPHGISNLKKVVSIDGVAYKSDLSEYAPLPFAAMSGGTSWNAAFEVNQTNINLELGNAYKSYYTWMIATIRYTKTTDV